MFNDNTATVISSAAPHARLCISSNGEFIAYSLIVIVKFAVGWVK
jgi:hypothetical protein